MLKPILLFLLLLFFSSCTQQPKEEAVKHAEALSTSSSKSVSVFSLAIFLTDSAQPNLGFGYNIIMDNHIFIHQPSIPSIAGNKGFSSKQKAEISAKYIIYKLEHNIMPPSVTPRELDSLGVLTK